MTATQRLRIGTRASTLARWQADWVAARLGELPNVVVDVVLVTTPGDRVQAVPVAAIGTEGVFTKEIERRLLAGDIDVAVHSMKDLPTEPVDGLTIAAVPERESVRDVLVSRAGVSFTELPDGAVIGTGSLRRRAQLWHVRSDLKMDDIRGNVETRLKKLDDGLYDAIVLAEAGLKRLGMIDKATEVFDPGRILPAVGQGALAIQARANDDAALTVLKHLDVPEAHQAASAERSMLAQLRGGCLAPVGGWARITEGGKLRLTGVVLSGDGRQRIEHSAEIDQAGIAEALQLGRRVADELIAQGAAELIQSARGSQ